MAKKKNEEEIAETPETTEQNAAAGETVEASAGDTAENGADVTAETSETETAPETVEAASAEETAAPAEEAPAAEAAPAAPKAEKPRKAAKPAKSETAESTETAGADKKVHKRAERIGIVSSDKMEKTVTVRVDRVVKHPVYRKYVKRRKKFMAHDELGAKAGDKVRIMETRPLSARKRWRVVEIIQRAAV
jgi:small subunit ribosomal protein S17